MASLPLPVYTGGAQVLVTHPQQKKTSVALSPSSPHPLIAHIVLVALVPKPWFLVPVCYVPVQVPVVGTQCPVGPVCVFPHSHSPMVVGLCSVILYRRFWVPLHQSPISTCPAGLPQALRPATHLPIFFSGWRGHSPVMSQQHHSTPSAVLVEGPRMSSESHPLSGILPTIQSLLPARVSPAQGISPSLEGQFSLLALHQRSPP